MTGLLWGHPVKPERGWESIHPNSWLGAATKDHTVPKSAWKWTPPTCPRWTPVLGEGAYLEGPEWSEAQQPPEDVLGLIKATPT